MLTIIAQHIADGWSPTRLALKLGLSVNEVRHIITQHQLTFQPEIFSPDCIPRICELYSQGVSAKALGRKFSIDKRRIQKWVQATGKLRSVSQANRLWNFRQEALDNITTPAQAYWLGFLYADGCNQSQVVRVSLQTQDLSHLEKLANFFNYPIEKITSSTTSLGHTSCTLSLYSQHLSRTLTSLGCPPAKSFLINYPLWLNENLQSHFLRGLFDGDGCLTKRYKKEENYDDWKWSLVSTDNMCLSWQKIIKQQLGLSLQVRNISQTEHNTSELSTSGNKKIYQLSQWLYQDSCSSIRLDRKYNKFLNLSQRYL